MTTSPPQPTEYETSNAIGIYLAAVALISLISVWLTSKLRMVGDLVSNPAVTNRGY
jgi:hypothetical protein